MLALVGTYGLLALFRKAIGCEAYVKRVRAFFVFVVGVVFEIIRSNLRIMWVSLSRNAGFIEGQFVDYDVSGLSEFEVLLISYCIGLSPGTMVADRSEDGNTLVLHIFATDADDARKVINRTLRDNILAFTR